MLHYYKCIYLRNAYLQYIKNALLFIFSKCAYLLYITPTKPIK